MTVYTKTPVFFSAVLALILIFTNASAKNITSKQSGNWSANSTWNGGTPSSGDNIIITLGTNVTLDMNINLSGSGSLTVNGTLTNSTGRNYSITLSDNATLVINGTTTIQGEISMQEFASLTVATTATLTAGEASFQDNSIATINGTMNTAENISVRDQSAIIGTGTITAVGTISTDDNAKIFGSAVDCTNCTKMGSSLPVEFIYFTAVKNGNRVELKWSTAVENNNNYFTIERSRNGIDFQEMEQIQGNGTSNSIRTYSSVDADPFSGTCFYRLSQTDFNGATHYLSTLTVQVSASDALSMNIFPTQTASASQINVQLVGKTNTSVQLVLRDLLGKEYFSKAILLENGNIAFTLDSNEQLASGIYIISVFGNNSCQSKKIVIK